MMHYISSITRKVVSTYQVISKCVLVLPRNFIWLFICKHSWNCSVEPRVVLGSVSLRKDKLVCWVQLSYRKPCLYFLTSSESGYKFSVILLFLALRLNYFFLDRLRRIRARCDVREIPLGFLLGFLCVYQESFWVWQWISASWDSSPPPLLLLLQPSLKAFLACGLLGPQPFLPL